VYQACVATDDQLIGLSSSIMLYLPTFWQPRTSMDISNAIPIWNHS